MEFSIDQQIFGLYPDLVIAVVVARGTANGKDNPAIQQMARREEQHARELFGVMGIPQHPHIASWRAAYRVYDPENKYRSSVEALVRRVVKGQELPAINNLVDLYNAISIKYVLPLGGEDLKAVKGSIRLSIADGDEEFIPLGQTENDPPEKGEVAYFDDDGCLCRRFNWREADRTKLTPLTKSAIFMIEGLPPATDIEVKEAAHALVEGLQRFCAAETEQFLLQSGKQSIAFNI